MKMRRGVKKSMMGHYGMDSGSGVAPSAVNVERKPIKRPAEDPMSSMGTSKAAPPPLKKRKPPKDDGLKKIAAPAGEVGGGVGRKKKDKYDPWKF